MDTHIAAEIVKKYLNYKDKWGFYPDPLSERDRLRIAEALKSVNYKPGDFSFIKNYGKRLALEHDYKVISRLNAWKSLINKDNTELYFYMYSLHTNETVKLSIEELSYIYKYGWTRYVLNNLS